MDAENPTFLRQFLVRVAATLLALLLLYPLSIGPAVYLTIKLKPRSNWLDRIYTPLLSATQDTPLEIPLGIYTGWWIRLAGGHSRR